MVRPWRVAIVGGGITGLAAAVRLRDRAPEGTEVIVYEQSGRLGGKLFTGELAGGPVEFGAESFLMRDPAGGESAAVTLARRLGLDEEIVHPTVGQAAWEGLATWVAERSWAARATGTFILAFELTFPVALVRRGLQPLYALVAVSLHVMTYVLLGLDYWAWALTVLLLFVDWPAALERWRGVRAARAGTAVG